MSVFVKSKFFAALQHPPYLLSDMASANLYLFVQLKLKGQCVVDSQDIIQTAMRQLKELSKKVFQECFQQLYECQGKSVNAKGEYFDSTVV